MARVHIQNIAEQVGDIAISKEESWRYTPKIESEVTTIAIGMDGAMMLMKDDGYREAMSGTIAFYNKDGDRLHTDYIAAAPEYGKSKFLNRMTREIECVKNKYPQAYYVGIADGASNNWKFLASHTDKQITDFYHTSEYLTKASQAIFKHNQEKHRITWLEKHCHNLKHEPNATADQLKELVQFANKNKLSAANKENLSTTITYFTNQGTRIKYAKYR